MAYVNPGDAFQGGVNDYLMQQEVLKRNAMLDNLRAKQIESEIEQGQAVLKEHRDNFEANLNAKDRTDLEKQIANLKPGDIPDADLMERAKKHGVAVPMTLPQKAELPASPVVPPGLPPAPPPGQAPSPVNAGVGAVRMTPPKPAMPATYAGSPKQRDELEKETKIADLMNKIAKLNSSDPEYRKAVLDYEMISGKTVSANLTGGAADNQEAVFRQNGAKGIVERLQNGQWVKWGGDVPKGAHFITEPTPKDTSAADVFHLAAVQNQAFTEIDRMAKPYDDAISAVNKAALDLGQHTAQADSMAAQLLLQATTAGVTGSGVRMSQPLIKGVTNGATKWEQIATHLNEWSTDPQKAKITPTQRQAMREFLMALGKKAKSQSDKVWKAKEDIAAATDAKSVIKRRAEFDKELNVLDEAVTSGLADSGDVDAQMRALLDKKRGGRGGQ